MPKRSETSYTAHYDETRPDAVMVRVAPHRYVNDTFLKTSSVSAPASRRAETTKGPGVKLKAKDKRKETLAIQSVFARK